MKIFQHLLLSALAILPAAVLAQTKDEDFSLRFGGSDNQAYTDWQATTSYSTSMYFPYDSNQGCAVHWSIDDDEIELAVAVRATNWVVFGLAETGGMVGSDAVIFRADTPNELTDAFVVDDSAVPTTDDCQNWELQNSVTSDGFLIFEATRKLDTMDPQDRVFFNDTSLLVSPSRIISAWGDTDDINVQSYSNSVKGTVRFFGQDAGNETATFERDMTAAEGSFELKMNNWTVRAQDTDYVYTCFTTSDLEGLNIPMDQQNTIIGIDPIVDNVKYIHHILVYAGMTDYDPTVLGECTLPVVFDILFVWTPGLAPVIFPSDVGIPLGGSNGGFLMLQLEIHYNNPWLDAGEVDNSGLKFYYNSIPREHQLGVMQTADPFILMRGQQVEQGGNKVHSFDCPSGCTEQAISQPITVFREYLHMHSAGARMLNTQMRNGEVIRTAAVDFYDYYEQGAFSTVQEPYTIEAGDSFDTRCFFDGEQEGREFGVSGQQEMCMTFLFYYPRQTFLVAGTDFELPVSCGYDLAQFGFGSCEAAHSATSESESVDIAFGISSGMCMEEDDEDEPTAAPNMAPSADTLMTAFPTADSSSPSSALMSIMTIISIVSIAGLGIV